MGELLVLSRAADLAKVAEAWDRLRKDQPRFFPDFHSVNFLLSDGKRDFRLLARKDGDHITSLACFVFGRVMKPYKVGERTLFSLPVQQVSLLGSAILGELDEALFDRFLEIVQAAFDFDLITFGEIEADSELQRAIYRRRPSLFVTSPARGGSIRWLVNLPETFDDYLAQLNSKLRQTVKRKMRKLEGEFKWEFRVISRVEQVEAFLRDAESVSRLTYQWNCGDRLCNDEVTRRLYVERANRGRLRSYIAYASGKPCAFLPGELIDDIFYYETPGYDPQYSKLSPGLVLLMWAVRDLIDQTDCKIFDFGPGGDATDYKSRFGNAAIDCNELELGRWSKPYAVAVMVLQEGLNMAKNVATRVLGQSKLRQQFKKAIRKYGES